MQRLFFMMMGMFFILGCHQHYQVTSYHDADNKILSSLGEVYYINDNGKITEILDGESKTWYKNGQLSSKINYKDGLPYGVLTMWYSNGNIMLEQNFDSNGLMDGEQFFYDINGNLVKQYSMCHGTGTEFIYDSNGKLKRKNEWRNGLLDGYVEVYNQEGAIEKKELYLRGEKKDETITAK